MKENKVEIIYYPTTGIMVDNCITGEVAKLLSEKGLVSISETECTKTFFVNPYVFKVDNPDSLLLSLFNEYKKGKNSRINFKNMKYPEYLKTDYWKGFRRKAIEHYNNKCDWCDVDGRKSTLHVHHVRYSEWFNEKIDNVVLLCGDCHSKAHGKYNK